MKFRFGAFADEAAKDFAGQIEALKRNRYEFLEIRNVDGINFTKLTLQEAKALAQQLQENGLSVRSLGSPIGKIKIGDDFDAHLELTKHTLEMGNIFGSQYIRLFSFFMPSTGVWSSTAWACWLRPPLPLASRPATKMKRVSTAMLPHAAVRSTRPCLR